MLLEMEKKLVAKIPNFDIWSQSRDMGTSVHWRLGFSAQVNGKKNSILPHISPPPLEIYIPRNILGGGGEKSFRSLELIRSWYIYTEKMAKSVSWLGGPGRSQTHRGHQFGVQGRGGGLGGGPQRSPEGPIHPHRPQRRPEGGCLLAPSFHQHCCHWTHQKYQTRRG